MIRATLDTNVLVSGLAGLEVPSSTPGRIVRQWLDGTFELVISAHIRAELERALRKPYYTSRRSPAQIEAAVRLIDREATFIEPSIVVSGVAMHTADDLILAVAVSADADYLVTGDKPVQRLGAYQRVRILSPRDFFVLLEGTSDEER